MLCILHKYQTCLNKVYFLLLGDYVGNRQDYQKEARLIVNKLLQSWASLQAEGHSATSLIQQCCMLVCLLVTHYVESQGNYTSKSPQAREAELLGSISSYNNYGTGGIIESKSQFMHLQTNMLWELNDIIHIKNMEECHA